MEPLEPRLLLDGEPIISEFMAINSSGLQDFEDEYSDWLEIHNPGTAPVDLTDWVLKDDNNQWIFPSMSLAPGEFRVIFASGKNLRDPAGELHTNFGLKGSGEYLGLLDDTGTVVHEYDPYPDQMPDISYGIGQEIDRTVFVASGDQATYSVPSGDPGGWTGRTFDDRTWDEGRTGIGYTDTVPGLAVWNYKASTTVASLSTALQVIDNPSMQSYVNSVNANFIDYYNSGNAHAHYTAGETNFPGFTSLQDDFVVKATGVVTIPTSGNWTFGVNSDDGFGLDVGSHHVEFAGTRGPADTFGTFYLTAGEYELTLVYFEQGGGAELELFAAFGSYTTFNSGAFDRVGDVANGGLAVVSQPVSSGAGMSGLVGLIETDVEDVMKGVNASMLLRMPFSVADPSQLESLTLKMKYDDGYVAYLNGQKIAEKNAPASPTWFASATDQRTDLQATNWEKVDVSAYLGRLASDNVLAIQALNYTASDEDFLILPELAQEILLGAGEHYFATATPWGTNTEEFWLYVEDTKFSHDRGFYEERFDLEITTDTEDAEIYYTTDGTEPSPTNGTRYTAPISIGSTTVLRAAAFKENYAPSNADTQTYLFLDDVITQAPDGQAPPGWPTTWGSNVVDYGMDPDIVNDPLYADTIKDDLKSIPSMSLVMNLDDLFGASGIYANASTRGLEKQGSLELVDPSGDQDLQFQVEAGVRIRGGYSRDTGNPKHAFRFFFRAEYGDSKLQFPLFGDEGADEFDNIDLRTTQNYSWSYAGDGSNTFLRDVFTRDHFGAMGQPTTRSEYYHLYINGMYWGLFQTQERSEASYAATYFGGDPEDYDVIKSAGNAAGYEIEVTDGSGDAYYQLWQASQAGFASDAAYYAVQGLDANGSPDPTKDCLLDVDNLIDYMISVYYGGDRDAPISNFIGNRVTNNFFAIYNREAPTGFKFFRHDAEHTLDKGLVDRTGPYLHSDLEQYRFFNPQTLHQKLTVHPEYVMRFADRVHRHFANGGALTPDVAVAMMQERASQIDRAIVGESARWGDSKRHPPHTRETWLNAANYIMNNFLPGRTATVLQQFKNKGWYPNITPPSFSIDGSYQHGGLIDLGALLTISAPTGIIYYTINGTDPRPRGGGTPNAGDRYTGSITLTEGAHVKARVYSGGQWSALCETTFYVDLAPSIRITEIMYNPADPTQQEIDAGYANNDLFEFLEIQNISATETLPLEGLRLTNGVDFTFGDVWVDPGDYVLVVKDEDAFRYRYPGFSGTIAGEFVDSSLNNGGERVELDAPVGGNIHNFRYGDGWYGHTDGDGFSLTIRDPLAERHDPVTGEDTWDRKESWRASAAEGGSPGYGDTLVDPGSVIITEVLAHSDDPYVDTIELHNVSDAPVNVSGWYLSDQKTDDLGNNVLTKYQIPTVPAIQPDAYLVLYENTHFGTAFSLSELGDDVYLSSNAGGTAGGYREHVDFGASPTNVAIGLYTKSTGGTDFTLLSAHSFGFANADPYLEDLVINEVLYHPLDPTPDEIAAGFDNDDDFEFVEIYNNSGTMPYLLRDFYVGGGIGFTFGWYNADSTGREAWTLEAGATATWNATLPVGMDAYEVFARWDLLDAEGDERDLDGRAVYRIDHALGFDEVIRDQKPELDDEGPDYMDAQGWVSLGTYLFDGSGQVTLTRGSDNPDNWTIADQVKFVSATHEELVDNPSFDSWYTANGQMGIFPGEYVVLVSNYAAFDARYDVAGNNIPVAGQYSGNLSNNGDKVKLMRVGDAEPTGYLPYYRIDYVNYNDAPPWPIEPDGQGAALNRLQTDQYGNDPINWGPSTLLGTPGAENVSIDPTPPTVPQDLTGQVTADPNTISLTWDPSQDPDTFVDHYVIYRDDVPVGTSATASYDDTDVTPAVFYTYQVAAVNRDGYQSDLSGPFMTAVPGVLSYAVPSGTQIELTFSEALTEATAETLGNYALSGGTLQGVELAPSGVKVILTTAPLVIGNPYVITMHNLATVSGNEVPDGLQVAFEYEPRGAGYIFRQYWTGIGGTAVSALTGNANYPDNPSGESFPTSLESPVDWADNYGTRIRGYVHPPTSGNYTFWVSGDDNCALYLSTNSNPDNAVQIATVPGWTNPRIWDRYPEQQSAPIALVAGQKYYIEVLHKEGTGGDSVAVRWQLPGGVWEDPGNPGMPIPGIRLSPYGAISTPVAENDAYEVAQGETLSVGGSGVLANDYDPVPGPADLTAEVVTGPAHAESFTLNPDGTFQYTPAPGHMGSDGFTYHVFDGNEYSEPATVSIMVVDVVRILSVEATDATHVELVFSTDLEAASAENAANYALDGGLSVQSASLAPDLVTVTLTVSPAITENQDYTLTVDDVRDLSGEHVIAPNTQVVFQHTTWQGQDIGAVGAAGSHSEQNGTWTIEAAGEDIWGQADEFHYVYQPLVGDATITARVASVERVDGWSKAGVMIRETLAANSVHAMAVVTPDNGVSFQRRRITGQDSYHTPGNAVVAPYWVRLVRQGNTFIGYQSPDGETWTEVARDSVSMTQQTVYIGLAVTSHVDANLCTAVIDSVSIELPDTTPPTVNIIDVAPDPRIEPVSQVEIVFSEPVVGFDLDDLSLTRDGGDNLLTGNETLYSDDGRVWTLAGLAPLTGGGGFVAYNDHVRDTGTHANTTNYSAMSGQPASGALKDITTGADIGVTLTVTQVGVNFASSQGDPAPGTDAYNLFNGYVDLGSGSGASLEVAGADEYVYVFSDLDPEATYDFHGTAIRGDDDYTDRWTLVTLVGAEGFTPAHSSGIGVVTDGLAANEVALWTGYNSTGDQGFVAGWLDVDPGADGEFEVVSTQYTGSVPTAVNPSGMADGSKGYGLSGIRLARVSTEGAPGTYTLSLTAAGSDITDTSNNPLAVGASDTWVIRSGDIQPPTADVIDVIPDAQNPAVDVVQIVFDEPVVGFDVGDLRLTRDGGDDLLTGDELLESPDGITWTLSGLAPLTSRTGSYTLTLQAAGSGIQDAAGNPLQGDASDTWTAEFPGRVEGRHVFYNSSVWDNFSGGSADDLAIAPDPAHASQPQFGKTALLPGETAGFANYTSYFKGINGIMVDLVGLQADATVADFEFRVGNDQDPDSWPLAPTPNQIATRAGQGDAGSDRVTIIFSDYAVRNQWLQVRVLATANTGLAEDDVFYFGNAVGESGNLAVDARVNAIDVLLARNNPRTLVNPAAIDFPYDYNRDKRVNATDILIARDNQTHLLSALKLITVPAAKQAAPAPIAEQETTSESNPADTLAWLYEIEPTQPQAKDDAPSQEAVDRLFLDY